MAERRRIQLAGKNYPPKRILVCGSRKWRWSFWVFMAVAGLKIRFGDDIVIIEGEARGVDTMAREAAECLGLEVDPYPADWRFGPVAGNLRNTKMIEEGKPDWVYAIGYGKGTADMVKQARAADIMVTWRYRSYRFN